MLGGRTIAIPRLRARTATSELMLPSFRWAADRDPLDAYTLCAIAAGTSMRRYGRALEPLPTGVAAASTSKSAVSRRFVALSTTRLHAFLSRPLVELDLRVIFIDGKVFKDHCMLIALGVASTGKKHVLGVREGATRERAGRYRLTRRSRRTGFVECASHALRDRWCQGTAQGRAWCVR